MEAEFAARVTTLLGKNLENPELVDVIFEICEREGRMSWMRDLAFYAKSFQKLSKLLASDRIIDATAAKAKDELETSVKKFAALVTAIVSRLPDDKKEKLHANFTLPARGAFTNLRTLLDDFVKVKDFMLLGGGKELGI